MAEEFRQRIISVGAKALDIMEEYFNGKRSGTDMVKEAGRMITEGVKVSNRDQVDTQVKRSQAIRLIPYIPKEEREKYIVFTTPETKPFLLARPKK